jgi:DNA-binding transcriptional LysR family regulator
LVPDLVSSFRTTHPDVQFALRPLRDDSVVADPGQRSRVDLEITTLRPSAGSSLHWRSLLVEPLRIAVPAGHRLAGASSIQLLDLADESFILLRPTSLLRQLCDRLCAAAGFAPQIAFEGDDLPTVRGFVAAGLGISIVPALHEGSPDVEDGPLRHVSLTDPGAYREIGFVWSGTQRLLPTARMFRRHVIDRAASQLLPAVTENG